MSDTLAVPYSRLFPLLSSTLDIFNMTFGSGKEISNSKSFCKNGSRDVKQGSIGAKSGSRECPSQLRGFADMSTLHSSLVGRGGNLLIVPYTTLLIFESAKSSTKQTP